MTPLARRCPWLPGYHSLKLQLRFTPAYYAKGKYRSRESSLCQNKYPASFTADRPAFGQRAGSGLLIVSILLLLLLLRLTWPCWSWSLTTTSIQIVSGCIHGLSIHHPNQVTSLDDGSCSTRPMITRIPLTDQLCFTPAYYAKGKHISRKRSLCQNKAGLAHWYPNPNFVFCGQGSQTRTVHLHHHTKGSACWSVWVGCPCLQDNWVN